MAKNRVLFIQTGGSIDKDYPNVIKSYEFEIGEPAARRILERINLNFEYDIITVLRKDSLDITDADRQKIYVACATSASDKIIITHGTDTMVQTGLVLAEIKEKLIVLTGAAKPEKLYDSDAAFNLGVAVGALNVLSRGVFIAMSGVIYPVNKVEKDPETCKFVEIENIN
ncbi:MAG: asparaginase [Candidatus Micrarchaeota archaeon]|nr:asparaginase [Candidatus Micrarchaeota archaeon]MDE1834704.1 asparaginase [Candidatus Micrarchaeota archaeon]MDE1859217.1 asparaginase [Candidatus Micrarchaeota archaeon]